MSEHYPHRIETRPTRHGGDYRLDPPEPPDYPHEFCPKCSGEIEWDDDGDGYCIGPEDYDPPWARQGCGWKYTNYEPEDLL